MMNYQISTYVQLLGVAKARLECQDVPFLSDKRFLLLAYLAYKGDWVGRESLAFLFWPDADTSTARKDLRHLLSRIRALNFAELESQGEQIRWRVDTDVACFQQFVAEGDWEKAIQVYGGRLLKGLTPDLSEYGEWLEQEQESLVRTYREAVLNRARQLEDQERHAEACALLAKVLKEDLLAEDMVQAYLRNAHKGGQREDGLKTYQAFEKLLGQELGLEPLEPTRQLAEALKQEPKPPHRPAPTPTSIPIPIPSQPVLSEEAPRLRNFPAQLTAFVGRDVDLSEIASSFKEPEIRLLTLIGPGGIGKTRLALQVAQEQAKNFKQGAAFVPLASLTTDNLAPAIASALGLSFSNNHSPEEQLKAHLGDQELLLVLDNLEHLLGAKHLLGASGIILELLESCPKLKVLTTSRAALGFHGEHLVEVAGLDVPDQEDAEHLEVYDAVQLFVRSAHRVNPRFILDPASKPYVARICRMLHGSPLGIELAANWIRVISAQEISQEMQQSLDFLKVGWPDLPERHRSLRAVFEHSWKLLSEEEQTALMQLSVFRGGFRKEAAEEVCPIALLTLLALTNKSLLQRTAEGRFEQHGMVLEFAQEKLEVHPQTAAQARLRHAQHYLGFLREHSNGTAQLSRAGLQQIRSELDNIRQAWTWAVETRHLDSLEKSAAGLARFYVNSSLFQEGERVYTQAAQQITSDLPATKLSATKLSATKLSATKLPAQDAAQLARVRLRLLSESIDFINLQTPSERVIGLAREVIALAESQGDTQSAARAYFQWGRQAVSRGDNKTALPLFEQGLGLAQQSGDKPLQGLLLRFIGNVWRQRGDYTQLTNKLQEALALQRELSNRSEEQTILTWLGAYGLKQHRYQQSRAYLEQALQLSRELGDPFRKYNAIHSLGHTDAALGDYQTARQRLEQAHRGFRELAAQWHRVLVLAELSRVCGRLGDLQHALSYGKEALSNAKAHGFSELKCVALRKLAFSLMLLRQLGEAQQALQEALEGWQTIGNPSACAEVQANLIELWGNDQPELAWPYLGPTLQHLLTHGFDGIDEPARVGLALYQTLQAHRDPRAKAILQQTLSFIRETAGEISEAHLQHLYLHGLSENREIISLGRVQL